MISFEEENLYLPIKTVAEYFFCERAAFYMLMNWENNLENPFLYKGSQDHRAIEKMSYKHRSAGKITYRQPVISDKLRIFGFCDAVEFNKENNPRPIEYKTGRIRENRMHRAQLYLQAMCLEEMHGVAIPSGQIYFTGSRARRLIKFSKRGKELILDKLSELRDKIARADIRDFRPCGHPLCSYAAIDDPVLYRRPISHVISGG